MSPPGASTSTSSPRPMLTRTATPAPTTALTLVVAVAVVEAVAAVSGVSASPPTSCASRSSDVDEGMGAGAASPAPAPTPTPKIKPRTPHTPLVRFRPTPSRRRTIVVFGDGEGEEEYEYGISMDAARAMLDTDTPARTPQGGSGAHATNGTEGARDMGTDTDTDALVLYTSAAPALAPGAVSAGFVRGEGSVTPKAVPEPLLSPSREQASESHADYEPVSSAQDVALETGSASAVHAEYDSDAEFGLVGLPVTTSMDSLASCESFVSCVSVASLGSCESFGSFVSPDAFEEFGDFDEGDFGVDAGAGFGFDSGSESGSALHSGADSGSGSVSGSMGSGLCISTSAAGAVNTEAKDEARAGTDVSLSPTCSPQIPAHRPTRCAVSLVAPGPSAGPGPSSSAGRPSPSPTVPPFETTFAPICAPTSTSETAAASAPKRVLRLLLGAAMEAFWSYWGESTWDA